MAEFLIQTLLGFSAHALVQCCLLYAESCLQASGKLSSLYQPRPKSATEYHPPNNKQFMDPRGSRLDKWQSPPRKRLFLQVGLGVCAALDVKAECEATIICILGCGHCLKGQTWCVLFQNLTCINLRSGIWNSYPSRNISEWCLTQPQLIWKELMVFYLLFLLHCKKILQTSYPNILGVKQLTGM